MTATIVARDPETGAMGAAVVAALMNVGALVPRAIAGVGVVATQASADPALGPLALDLVQGGLSAGDALKALLAVDELRDRRQVIVLDSDGSVAVHTGARVVATTSERAGPEVAAAASSLQRAVAAEMVEAFLAAEGDLAARLVAALVPARGAEGDVQKAIRSAALVVVGGETTGRPWEGVLWDLRVDAHVEPIGELRRLLDLKRAFRRSFVATGESMTGDPQGGLDAFGDLDARFPDVLDFAARKVMLLAAAGRMDDARALAAVLAQDGGGWRDQLRRYEDAGMLPEGLVAALFD